METSIANDVPMTVTTPPLIDEKSGLVDGLTVVGSFVIKSIRRDYADSPEYVGWTDKNTYTRLECDTVSSELSKNLDIVYRGPVTKIVLLNFPIGNYVLHLNGCNAMTSKGMIFDIENTHGSTLDNLVGLGEERYRTSCGPCMCGECIRTQCEYHAPTRRYLRLESFNNVRICYSSTLESALPDELQIELYDDGDTKHQETIYKQRYCIYPRFPTAQMSIRLGTVKPNARLMMKVSGWTWFDIPCGENQAETFVVRFSGNLSPGCHDAYLEGKVCGTCNFSRLAGVQLILKNCDDLQVHSSYYRTYRLPSLSCPKLSPMHLS